MIIWNWGGDSLNLGQAETRRCDTCEKERPFNIFLQYRYFALYYIFGFITGKKYLLLCEICQKGWELETKKIEAALQKIPIPFMRRYGLASAIALIIAVAIFLALWDTSI